MKKHSTKNFISFCIMSVTVVCIVFGGMRPVNVRAASASAAEAVERKDSDVKRNFSGEDSMAYPMNPDDVAASHFSLAADVKYVGVSCPSWSDSEGNLTLSLYAFNKDYETSVSAEPIVKHEFVNYADNAFLGFSFPEGSPLKAGEYVIQASDAVPDDAGEGGSGVGIWAQQPYAGQRFYENGEYNPSLSMRMAVEFLTETEPEVPYGTLTVSAPEGGNENIDYTPDLDVILKFSDEGAEEYFTMDNAMFIDSLEITDEGYLAVEVAEGNDPQFYINIPGWVDGPSRDDYPVMLIRMKQTAGKVANGEMFFSTDEFPGPAAGGAVVVAYEDTTEWQNVIVNLKSNKNFNGMLQSLRFDIVGATNEPCSYLIDYILFFASTEAAEAYKHEDFEKLTAARPTEEPATPEPEPSATPEVTQKPTASPVTSAPAGTQTPAASKESGGLATSEIIIIAVCAGIVVISAAVICAVLIKRKRAKK